MARILMVDDAASLAELFAGAIAQHQQHDVRVIVAVGDVPAAVRASIEAAERYDLALVDLSFP